MNEGRVCARAAGEEEEKRRGRREKICKSPLALMSACDAQSLSVRVRPRVIVTDRVNIGESAICMCMCEMLHMLG